MTRPWSGQLHAHGLNGLHHGQCQGDHQCRSKDRESGQPDANCPHSNAQASDAPAAGRLDCLGQESCTCRRHAQRFISSLKMAASLGTVALRWQGEPQDVEPTSGANTIEAVYAPSEGFVPSIAAIVENVKARRPKSKAAPSARAAKRAFPPTHRQSSSPKLGSSGN